MLQGQWVQIGFEEDGLAVPMSEHSASGAITTIDGCRFSVRIPGGELLLEGTFVLDASVRPKAITWTDSIGVDAGKKLPASYQLDNDHFVFIAADEGALRPTEFRTKPGQVMRRFARKR
ncbi:MAG TPA: TIGR03067 domain-containing protein [Rhodanobacteraceae bacterium]|nr:TIGR03067 domain-containing protein [Rhodanobacteraceae bacterium]